MSTTRPLSSKLTIRPQSTQSFQKTSMSRLSSGIIMPPKTGQSVLGISHINVLDRPITQQGVTGLQTTTLRGPQNRQVFDKRFYEDLIRMKMKDITLEIARLRGNIEVESQKQSTSQVYEKRVRQIATELTNLQGQLADYNLAIDKINTGTDKSHIDLDTDGLKKINENLSTNLDELFAENHAKKEQIHQVEEKIQQEKAVMTKLIQEMSEQDRNKYEEMKKVNEDFLKTIEEYQEQLDMLTNKKLDYEDRISGSQIRQEIVRLYHKLRERENRRDVLLEEERTRSTPAQEREKLLKRVREDNAEMIPLDRQINQLNEQIKKKKEELEIIEQDLEESQSDRHQKFKELKKREETMEQFLSTFQEISNNENDKIEEFERDIVVTLLQISKNIKADTKFPSKDEFAVMKENLILKQEELERSKMTVEELKRKRNDLFNKLNKVDELEGKIQNEIATTQEKIITMSEELKIYSDLDSLKEKAREKRENLTKEKENLMIKIDSLTKTKHDLEKESKDLNYELNENETYVQLKNLEKKLEVLEQNNITMKEFIETKKVEMEYEPYKYEALKMVKEYNQTLIASHSK